MTFAVVFAGVPGSSKTIISNYLSVKFNLPIFNNDQLRFEVKEDLMADNINRPDVLAEFEKRYTLRFEEFLSTRHPMILDGSVDRRWQQTKAQLTKFGYGWFLIDMELSRPFLENLFISTARPKFLDKLNPYIKDHDNFMKKYSSDVGLIIRDDEFLDRLKLASQGLAEFIAQLEK